MPQPIKRNIRNQAVTNKKKVTNRGNRRKKTHPDYGTSKLEERFAKEFLDKLDIDYRYQFKAESIGRYYDFCIPYNRVLIEVDGDYYHAYGLVEEQMNRMQKHNRRVDEQKNHWALINGYKLYRIWEHDINKNPEGVMQFLREKLTMTKAEQDKLKNKKRRH